MSKTTPKLGTAYPVRIGKTLRNAARSRSLLSLKFTHVPDNTQLTQPGCLTRQDDKCTVSLSATDGQGVLFTGAKSTKTAVTEYVLVFVNNAMWLERADDVFPGMRPTLGDYMDVPNGVGDDVHGDPDSWMVEESGSPITPEGNEGEEVRRPVLGGGIGGATGIVGGGQGQVGVKSVATKTVANKGLHTAVRANGSDTVATSSDEDDDSDNNSDSDDSDEDDESDDSNDSSAYTDRSSDED